MIYWAAGTVLTILNAVCVAANLFLLPGNWIMVGTLCVFLLFAGTTTGPDAWTLIIVIALAGLGELIEFLTGSVVAARQGASRRALLLSLCGSFVLSIVGTVLITIPLVGTLIGALTGAAVGAFAGAWIGESWKGSRPEDRLAVSRAAMTGRVLGLFGKLAVGAAIFVFQLISLW